MKVFPTSTTLSIPRYSFRAAIDENMTRVYKSWKFTHATSEQLRMSKMVTALNFATLEMSLNLKISDQRKTDKEYADMVRNSKT